MPIVFLSPSTQEYNLFYDGNGSEEYYMNLIADAMVPYLEASGITVARNTPEDTALTSAQKSNEAGTAASGTAFQRCAGGAGGTAARHRCILLHRKHGG